MKSTESSPSSFTGIAITGSPNIQSVLSSGWIWLLLPLACHWGFSWIGFSPTDEGWLQAIARRMINGEIPHRDFISIRPVLSPALQIPLVWLGGDHVFWLARLWGWMVAGGIAWLWSGFLTDAKTPAWGRLMFYAVIFFLNVHTFPMLAWHSLDGLLFASVAVALARRQTISALRGAFICAGLATLCRQNFIFFLPFLGLGLPDRKQWRITLWVLLPPAIYLLALVCGGALVDFVMQIRASRGLLLQSAFTKFVQTPHVFGGCSVGLLIACALRYSRSPRPQITQGLTWITLGTTGFYSAANLWIGPVNNINGSFVLFGFSSALLVGAIWRSHPPKHVLFPLVAALGLAWTGAISGGYNCPALMSGVLLVVSWRTLELLSGTPLLSSPIGKIATSLVLISVAAGFWYTRIINPYQDRPATELEWEAGNVLRGASGLRTNAITYAVLNDLRTLTDRFDAQHKPYAILTDYSAAWVQSAQRNPLNCEWPQSTELGDDPRLTQRSPELIQRLMRQMGHLPADTKIIVQRHTLQFANYGLFPVANAADFYRFQIWFCQHAQRIEQTPYFDLYLPLQRSNNAIVTAE